MLRENGLCLRKIPQTWKIAERMKDLKHFCAVGLGLPAGAGHRASAVCGRKLTVCLRNGVCHV